MPSTLTNFGRQWLLKSAFRRESTTVASPIQLALTTTIADISHLASQLVEPPAGIGYARQNVTIAAANWVFNAQGEIQYTTEILFGTPTGQWGLIQGWALVASTELIAVGTFANPRRVGPGTRARIPGSAITVALTDA